MLVDTLDGRGPLYRQLYRSLRQAILDGRARAGSRLPSTRWIASETGVARNRVVLAYAQLLDEGYAVGRVGSGTYVASALPGAERAALSARRGATEPPPVRLSRAGRALVARGVAWTGTSGALRYDFSCGRPSFRDFPHSVWARLIRRRARLTSAFDLDYAPPAGLPDLREQIAAHLTRWRGVACTADQVLVTNGSQQALGIAASMLVEPGERVALEEPHYAGARQAFEGARAAIVPIRVDDHGLDVTHLASHRRVRLVYVTPAHQFPTGAVLPLARRLALLEWARGAGAYIVEDDYDSEYRYAGAPIESLQGLDRAGRVFYLGSFSKILSPALRLGYLVVPRALTRGFMLAKTAADLGTATFGQRVLADFIAAGHLEVHLRRSRRRHAARRTALLTAIAELLGERVQVLGGAAGLHVMLVLPHTKAADVAAIVQRARERDVGIYPTGPLYLSRPRRAEFLLGHGSLSEDDIRRGVERLAGVLGSH
jgi:GntR family transcriptional regulator / MocR family aminotransferase